MIRSMGGSEWAVREATAGDPDALWPLVRDFATSFTPERATFDASFLALRADGSMFLRVAESAGALVGYVVATSHPTLFADGHVCWVEELMVSRQHRRVGIGAALLAAAELWAQDRGAAYVSLATRRAADFYLAQGCEESATFFNKPLR